MTRVLLVEDDDKLGRQVTDGLRAAGHDRQGPRAGTRCRRLTTPFWPEELVARVRAAMQEAIDTGHLKWLTRVNLLEHRS